MLSRRSWSGPSLARPGGKARRKLHPLPILSNLADLLAHVPTRNAERPGLLALDVSKRAIGVAGADAGWRLATPLTTIRRKRLAQDLARLERIIEERAAGTLVLGWPLNMDGSEGPRCQAVREFAEHLDAALALPILLWDERLTTFAAEEAAAQAGLRGKRRAEMLDALAAAALLQDVLNTLAGRRLHQDQARRSDRQQATTAKEEPMSESMYPQPTKQMAEKRRALAPEIEAAFRQFNQAVFKDGALPEKTKQLIAVAVAHVTQCPYCIRGHTKAALRKGATPEELMEAIWVAAEMRAGGAYAHSTLALETIEEAGGRGD
jgi:putative transcription antitermination factor YqgF